MERKSPAGLAGLRLSTNLGRYWRAEVLQLRSKISDMCGDFRRNFEEIPTLPEQTAVKTEGFSSSSEGKNQQSGEVTLLMR